MGTPQAGSYSTLSFSRVLKESERLNHLCPCLSWSVQPRCKPLKRVMLGLERLRGTRRLEVTPLTPLSTDLHDFRGSRHTSSPIMTPVTATTTARAPLQILKAKGPCRRFASVGQAAAMVVRRKDHFTIIELRGGRLLPAAWIGMGICRRNLAEPSLSFPHRRPTTGAAGRSI